MSQRQMNFSKYFTSTLMSFLEEQTQVMSRGEVVRLFSGEQRTTRRLFAWSAMLGLKLRF